MALTDCPDLQSLEGNSLDEFKRAGNQWINAYGVCRMKHEIVRECFEATQDR